MGLELPRSLLLSHPRDFESHRQTYIGDWLGLQGVTVTIDEPDDDEHEHSKEYHPPDEDGYGAGTGDTNYGDDREYREANEVDDYKYEDDPTPLHGMDEGDHKYRYGMDE